MKRRVLGFLLAISLCVGVSAQKGSELGFGDAIRKEPAVSAEEERDTEFFSDELPRYTGFAVGAHFLNQYAIGDWADFARANLGGGIDAEYTLPLHLPKNLDLGVSGRVEFAHVFPKSGGTLKRDDELNFFAGVWLRVPFLLAGQTFAFQPEISYGMILHHAEGRNGSNADGWFGDNALSLSLGLRYIAPSASLQNVEFELAPVYTFSAEKEGYSVNQLGFRLGAVWHIQSFVNQRKAEK